MPVYRVIYDVNAPGDWWFLLSTLFMAAAGAVIWGVGTLDRRFLLRSGAGAQTSEAMKRAGHLRRMGALLALVMPLLSGTWAAVQNSDQQMLRRALAKGQYVVVEGQVTDFVRGDREGHRGERFSVISNGRRYTYEYRSSNSEPGFYQSHGPIREGLHVRIADVRGYIARLEVRTIEDPATYRPHRAASR